MYRNLRNIHGGTGKAIATVSICMMVCAAPARGQVVDAHYDNSLTANESAYCPHENAIPIDGQVRTSDNAPLPKTVRVILETAEGAFSDQQFPGADGRFHFLTVQGNKYRIVVMADGFQRASQTVDDDWGASHSPTIFLVRSGKGNSAAPAEAASDAAAPKAARKEFDAGMRALQAGNPEDARKHLEKAVSAYPCFARAQSALGASLAVQHDLAPAESAFRNSIKCDAGFLEAYLRLAVLLKTEGRYPACRTLLELGVRQFPNEWTVHYQLGNVDAALGDYPGAEQEFLKAQTLNTTPPPEMHVRLAEFYQDWKKYGKARAEAETYLRVEPHGPLAASARKILQELRASEALNTVVKPTISTSQQ
jgi:tetratricopeptide (TPR) repeat protein